MDTASTSYRVHQCSQCSGDTEYYCESCPCDLCPQCKENHVKHLKTIDHNVETYREKCSNNSKQEICVRHPSKIYGKYCEPCELAVCLHLQRHRDHIKPDAKTDSHTKQQYKGTVHTIRSDTLFNK